MSCVAAVALVSSVASLAHAHPDLDAGIAHADDADFEAALSSFDAALASGELSRGELVTLFAERALVRHALGQHEALGRDLGVLAMLDPEHDLGKAAPPGLVASWNDMRTSQGAPLAVTASCGVAAAGTRVEADVTGLRDPALAQVFVHTRTDGQSWVQRQATSADIAVHADELEFYVDVRGPGGVALASAGSEDAPLRCSTVGNEADLAAANSATQDAPRRHRKLWWWIGGAGAAAAAVIATTFLVVSSKNSDKSSQTVVSKPMVSF